MIDETVIIGPFVVEIEGERRACWAVGVEDDWEGVKNNQQQEGERLISTKKSVTDKNSNDNDDNITTIQKIHTTFFLFLFLFQYSNTAADDNDDEDTGSTRGCQLR